MNFDYCLQTQEKNKNNKNHSTVIHNVYFLVLDYLEPWLNFMIVSVFVLESRQVGDVQNPEPQTQWLSVNARLDTLSVNFPVYKVKIFQNVTQNLLSQNCVNLLHLSPLMNVKIKLDLKTFKRKNLVLVFWNFLSSYVQTLNPACIRLKVKIEFEALQPLCKLQNFTDPTQMGTHP